MTVAEYIAALQQLPQEAEVVEDGSGAICDALEPEARRVHIVPHGHMRCDGVGCKLCQIGVTLVTVVVL